ncbi:hypothetical protein BKI49_18500 [Streptomyces sp. Tue6028]|uniref:hypothetical protein n=1 Tax=Streptomyces sp. Tue6028 TaxID=2036037 RepID=UPI000BB37D4A|nr:hypothetical protein [Streptomyces sp. Tue6028]PBC62258.1 hypothetical protein BKI49_18500 [Streptomyces sp. Tue6028]
MSSSLTPPPPSWDPEYAPEPTWAAAARSGPRRSHRAPGRFRGLLDTLLRHGRPDPHPDAAGTPVRHPSDAPAAAGPYASHHEVTRWQRHADAYERLSDGLDRERAHLLAWLAALHPASAVVTPVTDDGDGWEVLHLTAGGEVMSWPISPRNAHLFRHAPRRTPRPGEAYRGTDDRETEAKYAHIRRHTSLLALEDGVAAFVSELRHGG